MVSYFVVKPPPSSPALDYDTGWLLVVLPAWINDPFPAVPGTVSRWERDIVIIKHSFTRETGVSQWLYFKGCGFSHNLPFVANRLQRVEVLKHDDLFRASGDRQLNIWLAGQRSRVLWLRSISSLL